MKEVESMKEFTTISERDILRYASYDIMERMSREEEINKNNNNSNGAYFK